MCESRVMDVSTADPLGPYWAQLVAATWLSLREGLRGTLVGGTCLSAGGRPHWMAARTILSCFDAVA
jgi:hypothetical protein